MKKVKYILAFILSSITLSCITENDVFEEEFIPENDAAVATPLIVSLLNRPYFRNRSPVSPQTCFRFIFPIELEFNGGQRVRIASDEALLDIVNSQSAAFYVNAIIFPIEMRLDEETFLLEDETALLQAFDRCNIVRLRRELVRNLNDCLAFEYPINFIDDDDSLVPVASDQELRAFLNQKGDRYITNIEFPIFLNDTRAANLFRFYRVLEDCTTIQETCLPTTMLAESLSSTVYEFSIESDAESLTEISWFVNDTLVANENNETLNYRFIGDNTYEVCSRVTQENCSEEQVSCTEVEIAITDCSDLFFTITQESDGTYRCSVPAAIAEKYSFYEWTFTDTIANVRNEDFIVEVSGPGSYQICVFTETVACPRGTVYCETLVIP